MEEKQFELISASCHLSCQMADNTAFPVWRWVGLFFSSRSYPVPLTMPSLSFLESRQNFEPFARSKKRMQVLSLLLISFAYVVCPSLGKEGNYNEAERSLPENEWLNPWDMIHYDAAAQSLDSTVSLLLISPQRAHTICRVADCYFIVMY